MTINHCLRISQWWQNRRMLILQSFSEHGNTLGVDITALTVEGRIRCASISTMRCLPQSNNYLKCFSSCWNNHACLHAVCRLTKICPVTYGEFHHWLGLWFLIGTIYDPEHSEVWSLGEVDCFVRAQMRLGAFMSYK